MLDRVSIGCPFSARICRMAFCPKHRAASRTMRLAAFPERQKERRRQQASQGTRTVSSKQGLCYARIGLNPCGQKPFTGQGATRVHYGTTVETVSLHLTKSEQRLIDEANMQPWEIPRQEDLKNLAQGEIHLRSPERRSYCVKLAGPCVPSGGSAPVKSAQDRKQN